MLRFLLVGLVIAVLQIGSWRAMAAGQAKYFVLVVWDGMRPDFVTPDLTPTLYGLRKSGVWFGNHHSVYPTSTEVNGTVLSTGVFPRRSGVTANWDYHAEIDPLKPYGTESFAAIRRGDEVSGGNYLHVCTLAEMVQANGERTAVVGAKGVVLLHDRRARTNDVNPVWFATDSLPGSLLASLTNRFGNFPDTATPNIARDTWAARCLMEGFWGKELPRYSVLWLSEPDFSQHHNGPGSPQALEAIRSCDQRLKTVLDELDRRGIRAQTDIIVVSDHGFSTIGEDGDNAAALRAAGLNARSTWDKPPQPDDIVCAGNGGSVLFYVIGKSPTVIQKVVATLQQNPNSGVIFTRDGLPGTLPLSEAMLDSSNAPDVVVSSSWKMSPPTDSHLHVEVVNDGYAAYHAGGGMHVTLSPTDLHNTAVASGPDFRHGFTSPLPSGNIDIVPTLVYLMGLTPPAPLDGRILSEALAGNTAPMPKIQPGRREAKTELTDGTWREYLKFTEVNGVRYLEEGNGRWMPAASQPASH
ncbi:MAG TPA: alkaline phosphatase family protein [Verrucomicrobiae bacterium]|nr:alkaline phosphatase family protein [Verrucomicrobiae bacterium]